MGVEFGVIIFIFLFDEVIYEFLKVQGREVDFVEILLDFDVQYDEEIEIDLLSLVLFVVCLYSFDNVVFVSELKGIKVDQVVIGSCINLFYKDFMKVVKILEGKIIVEYVLFVIFLGLKQVLNMFV